MNLYKYHTNPETLYGYESMKRFKKPSVEMVEQIIADGGHFDKFPYSMITHLPDGLKVDGSLWLRNASITHLPDGLYVGGHLTLSSSEIAHIGDGLRVSWDLYLDDTPNLDKDNLPSDMIVKGRIFK